MRTLSLGTLILYHIVCGSHILNMLWGLQNAFYCFLFKKRKSPAKMLKLELHTAKREYCLLKIQLIYNILVLNYITNPNVIRTAGL